MTKSSIASLKASAKKLKTDVDTLCAQTPGADPQQLQVITTEIRKIVTEHSEQFDDTAVAA